MICFKLSLALIGFHLIGSVFAVPLTGESDNLGNGASDVVKTQGTTISRQPFDGQEIGDSSYSITSPMAMEAHRLLKLGEQQIDLRDDLRDLTLVVGRTGVGKSTITHLLSGNNADMEVKEGKIGGFRIDRAERVLLPHQTKSSKSNFPELVVDSATGEPLYDYPGIKVSQEVSTEIANTVFTKKVADWGRRARILIIADLNSVQSGGDRRHFRDVVRYLLGFVRNIEKFQHSFALIITKVDVTATTEEITESVAEFIQQAQEEWEESSAPEMQHGKIRVLTESLLQKDARGRYTNIGTFRQPTRVGIVSELAEVQENREALRQIVFHNPNFKYQEKEEPDFGSFLSADSKDVAQTMVQGLLVNVTTHLRVLKGVIVDSYVQTMSRIPSFDEKITLVSKDSKLLPNFLALVPRDVYDCPISIAGIDKLILGLTKSMNVNLDAELLQAVREDSSHVGLLEDVSNTACVGSGREKVRQNVAEILEHLQKSVLSFSTYYSEVQELVNQFTDKLGRLHQSTYEWSSFNPARE